MATVKTVIPPPRHSDEEPFQVGDRLSVFEAAMVYAGRHPRPRFLKNDTVTDHLEFLGAGVRDSPPSERARLRERSRVRARRTRNIYYELIDRIRHGRIIAAKAEYLRGGEIDPLRTVILKTDLIDLARERGETCKYLGVINKTSKPKTARLYRKMTNTEYQARLANFLKANGRYPKRDEDEKWAQTEQIPRIRIRELRSNSLPEKIKKGGALERRATKNPGEKNLAVGLPVSPPGSQGPLLQVESTCMRLPDDDPR